MKLICQRCNTIIAQQDFNLSEGIANCTSCNEVFWIADSLRSDDEISQMKKKHSIQTKRHKTQLRLAIYLILSCVLLAACKPNSAKTKEECDKLLDHALKEDPMTGEVLFTIKDKVSINECWEVDKWDMVWLSMWFVDKTKHYPVSTPEPITYRMMMDVVNEFRESPNYDYSRSMMVRRERINDEKYKSETWPDAKQYYLDLNWSPSMVDSFHVFLARPKHIGLTYKKAVSAFMWSRAHHNADPI